MSTVRICKATKCSKKCKYLVSYKDRYGKWREKHGFETKKACEVERLNIESELAQGVISSERAMQLTMNEYVQTIELSKGNERTKAYAIARYNNWLKDNLGNMKLKDITRYDIDNYFEEELVGYSGSLKRKILTHISTVFKYATADGLVNRNPALAVHLSDDKRVNEPNPLNRKEFHEFIDIWDNDKVLVEHANFIVAMGYLGCRPQELGALTWDNVDLEERVVYIRQAIKKDAKGGQYIGELKSSNGRRALAIPDYLLGRLRFMKSKNPSDKYVFSSSLGKMINLNNFNKRYFNKAKLMSSLPIENLYDLRHTFSAMMRANDCTIVELAEMLGHDYKVTKAWYGVWFEKANFKYLSAVDSWKQKQA